MWSERRHLLGSDRAAVLVAPDEHNTNNLILIESSQQQRSKYYSIVYKIEMIILRLLSKVYRLDLFGEEATTIMSST